MVTESILVEFLPIFCLKSNSLFARNFKTRREVLGCA